MKKIFIIVSLAIGIPALLIIAFLIYDNASQPYIITNTLQKYASQPELFTKDKLTSYGVDGPVNLNGDEELHGVYKLSHENVVELLSHKPLLNCNKTHTCNFEDPSILQNGNYCEDVKQNGHELVLSLCIHTDTDEAYWSYMFY